MYRVVYYINGSSAVGIVEFDTFKSAIEFCKDKPENSILEIKHYDDKTNNFQNKSNTDS